MTDPSPAPPDFADWDSEYEDLQVDDYTASDLRDGYFTRPELAEHFGCRANSSRFGTLLKQLKEQNRLVSRRTYRVDASGRRFPLQAFKLLPKPDPHIRSVDEMERVEECAKRIYSSRKVAITEGFPSHDPAVHIHDTPSQETISCPEPPSQQPYPPASSTASTPSRLP